MLNKKADSRSALRPRGGTLLGLMGAALLLHVGLLGAVASAGNRRGDSAPAAVMHVRTLQPLADAGMPDPSAATARPVAGIETMESVGLQPAAPADATKGGRARRARVAKAEKSDAAPAGETGAGGLSPIAPAAQRPERLRETTTEAVPGVSGSVEANAENVAEAQGLQDALMALAASPGDPAHAASHAATVSAVFSAAAESAIPPVYRTQFPPSLTVRYSLRRGELRGTGELQWRSNADGSYQLRLQGRLLGVNLLTQLSSGVFDAAGLAPVRYTDQRSLGPLRAANFQRAAGKITFSGPTSEFPLLAGSQDRVSWMLQLPAVVTAEPERRSVGATVVMNVAGARGDVDVWAFRCMGPDIVELGTGTKTTLKFERLPRSAHDTRVEIWLDPQQRFLPVRARLHNGADGDALDLRLSELVSEP